MGKYINTRVFKTRSENESPFAKFPDRTSMPNRIKEATASWPKFFHPTHSQRQRSKQKNIKPRHFLGLLPSRDVGTHHFPCITSQVRTILQAKKELTTHGHHTPGKQHNCNVCTRRGIISLLFFQY